MKRLLLTLCLLVLPITAALPAVASTEEDPRLDQRVTIKTAGKPLADLLSIVSEATGVKMTARRNVADYRVCMYVKDLPLSRLLDALKTVHHLQYTQKGAQGEWSYEFWEDTNTRRDVERLKKQELDKFRAVVQNLVDDLRLSDKDLIAKFGRKKDVPYALQYPRDRSLLRAYSLVDEPQLDQFWQKGTLHLDKAGISAEIQNELLRGLNDDTEPDWDEPAGEQVEADTVEEVASEYYHLNEWTAVDSIDFRIEDSGSPSGMLLSIYVTGDSIDISGPNPEDRKASRSAMDISVGPKEYEDTPAADPIEAMLSGEEDKEPAEPEWPISRYVEDPSLGIESPHDEDGEYVEGAVVEEQPVAQTEAEYVPPLTHYQMLATIAEKTGANIVSDRFASVDVPAWIVSDRPGDWPLSVIDKLAEGMNADMTKDSGLWLLVNREWFRNRDREVPERLVQRWLPTAKKLGYLDLEQIIEIATLTDPQVMSLPSYGLPYAGEVTGDRERLYLLAGLTPSQWTAIKSEDGLPISSLSEQQRHEFLSWLTRDRAESFEWVSEIDDAEYGPPGEVKAIRIEPADLDWDDNGRKVRTWDFVVCHEALQSYSGLPSAIYDQTGNEYGTVEISVAGKP